MCSPLRGKKAIKNGQVEFFDLYGDSVKYEFFFESDVKSAVEFYKRYRFDMALLREKAPKHYENYDLQRGIKSYDIWLFDYCFQDVIEK